MFRFLTLLLAVAIVAQAYDSKCCKKGHNCCKKGDTKTGERRSDCVAWLRRSICKRATTTLPTTRAPKTTTPATTRRPTTTTHDHSCKVSLPDCQLTDSCLKATCSIKASPFPTISFGFAIDPCNPQGPTLSVDLSAGGVSFSHTFNGTADITTPISVKIPDVASASLYIHVVIGDIANNELPLTISLKYKYKIPVVGTKHKTLVTIFDGQFPIDSPCAMIVRKPVLVELN
eukprot:m.41210 g.41210  ORF g.41210 m.41210 type:complete len:231 (+) comp12814_c0_seq6:484-1176(+)